MNMQAVESEKMQVPPRLEQTGTLSLGRRGMEIENGVNHARSGGGWRRLALELAQGNGRAFARMRSSHETSNCLRFRAWPLRPDDRSNSAKTSRAELVCVPVVGENAKGRLQVIGAQRRLHGHGRKVSAPSLGRRRGGSEGG